MRLLNWQHDCLEYVVLSSGKTPNVSPFYFWDANTFLAKQFPFLFKRCERRNESFLSRLVIPLKQELDQLLDFEECFALKVPSYTFKIQVVTSHERFKQSLPISFFW